MSAVGNAKYYGTGDGVPSAVRYASQNLRSLVTASLAAVIREQPERPLTEVIKKLRAHSLEQDGIEKPLSVKIDGFNVSLENRACKTEVMLPRHGLYGLHMPSVQNWQDVLDFIRQDNPTAKELIMIVELQDPGADLVFVNDAPYYANLTELRQARKRTQLSAVALNPALLGKLNKSIRGGHNVHHHTAGPKSPIRALEDAAAAEINQSLLVGGATDRRISVMSDVSIGENTMRPGNSRQVAAETVTRGPTPVPPPLAAVKPFMGDGVATGGGGGGLLSKSSRRMSRVHLAPEPPAPETVCSSVLSTIPNASPRTVYQVIELITRQWESLKTAHDEVPTVRAHTITPNMVSKSPLAIFDHIDRAVGLQDSASSPPVLVVSFRSRRLLWRKLLARVYATMSPNVEYSMMQRAHNLEAAKTSEREELQSQRHSYYWREVIRQRAERDSKRKGHIIALKALHQGAGSPLDSLSLGERKVSSLTARPNFNLDSTSNLMTAMGQLGKKSVSNLSEATTNVDLQDTTRSQLGSTARGDLNTLLNTITKAAAIREKRRQEEDRQHCIIEAEERHKAAVKIQAAFRGAKERYIRSQGMVLESTSSVFVTPGQDLASATFDQKFKHTASEKIDAPALVRRVYDKAAQNNPGLLTMAIPAPKAPAVRFQFWSHTKTRIPPQYDGDVSSDEEAFESKVVIVPPKSASKRRRNFNPLLRLQEINALAGYDEYEWATNVTVEFKGLSTLQRRAYEVFKNHALELLHVIFVEIHHRQAFENGVNPAMSFSEYVKTFFADIFSWFSLPHFVSLSTAPELASPLQYGPPSPLVDRLLYQSASPSLLPWGRQAPLHASDDESAWFMPHWDENAPMKVLTTIDFASAPVWKKQLDYLTLNGRPVWWFSMCPDLGIYVNNQPFIAARRPEAQSVEGYTSSGAIESVVEIPPVPSIHKYPDPPTGRGLGKGRSPERLQSSKSSMFHASKTLQGTSANKRATFNEKTAALNSPSDSSFLASPTIDFRNASGRSSGMASFMKSEYDLPSSELPGPKITFAPESLTLVYPDGGKVRLRTWFGVHWTEMERRLRLQVAQDAFNNAMHVTCYSIESLCATDDFPTTPIRDDISEISIVRPIEENTSFGDNTTKYDPTQSLLEDTHVFKGAVNYTEAWEAPVVQACTVPIIPPPKKIKVQRSISPDPSNKEGGGRRSRSNSRGPEARARSMRRLRSLNSVRNPDSASNNNTITFSGTGTANSAKLRPSISMLGSNDESFGVVSSNPLFEAPSPYSPPVLEDALRRVRTAPTLAEGLFSPAVPKCRYLRTPALEVSGYQWWCSVDQYLGLVHQGLRQEANIAVAITSERQLFYSVAALMVAHSVVANTDEIEGIYDMEQRRQNDLLAEARKKKEARRKANYDPDDHGNKNDWLLDPSDREMDRSLSTSGISFESSSQAITAGRSLSSMQTMFTSGEPSQNRYEPTGFILSFVQLCSSALDTDLTKALAVFNSFLAGIGSEFFLQAIEADVARAERASTQKEVRQHVISAVQRTERYCNLFLVYLFLRSRPKGEEELQSIIPWLFGARLEPVMEWLNDIDPWMNAPLRSPDPLHHMYSSIYTRWSETDAYVSRAM